MSPFSLKFLFTKKCFIVIRSIKSNRPRKNHNTIREIGIEIEILFGMPNKVLVMSGDEVSESAKKMRWRHT
jgi:hypothetical protein